MWKLINQKEFIKRTTMLESGYIRDILNLTVEGQKYEDILFEQIKYLILTETEYTGIGCYYYFEHVSKIEKHRLIKINYLIYLENIVIYLKI